MNKVMLKGNIATDIRYTEGDDSKKSRAWLKLAVSTSRKEETSFPSFVCWAGHADSLAQHCAKGDEITVEGELMVKDIAHDADGNVIERDENGKLMGTPDPDKWTTQMEVRNQGFIEFGRKSPKNVAPKEEKVLEADELLKALGKLEGEEVNQVAEKLAEILSVKSAAAEV